MPEQGHQVPQEEGDGDGGQVGGPEDRAEGAIGTIFFGQSSLPQYSYKVGSSNYDF